MAVAALVIQGATPLHAESCDGGPCGAPVYLAVTTGLPAYGESGFTHGYDAAIAVGLVGPFGGLFRAELEGGFHVNDAGAVSGSALSGRYDALSLMANGYIGFPTFALEPLYPFIGMGFGAARVDANATAANGRDTIDGSQTGFAVQAMAGFSTAWGVVSYRYFRMPGLELGLRNGGRIDADYGSHSIVFTLPFFLGEIGP
ncbi:MAG: hypothetical protein AB7N54_17925 [Alphaproteobacteria bacterium]